MHFPVRPDHLGIMAPIPAVATLPTSAGKKLEIATAASIQAQVDERAGAFMAELRPQGTLAAFLTRRAAVLSVRLDRLTQYQAASVALRVRRAEGEFTANRLAEVDHLHSWINAEPATYARRLRQSPEGIDRMLDSWDGLRREITDPEFPRWDADHMMLAASLTGRRSHDLPVHAVRLYSEAYFGHPSVLVNGTPELATLNPAQRQEFARVKLVAIIDAEIDRLRLDRAAIDLSAIDRDRAEATDRALFDPTPAGTLANRYELATERSLHRTLRTVAELAIAAEPEAEIAPDDLIEKAPDPTLMDSGPDLTRGKRSRLHVAFIKAGRRAAAARAAAFDPASATDEAGRPRRRRL